MPDRTESGDDWGPFGRPLFQDPSARALSRVGVVDVGSKLGPDGGLRRGGTQPRLFLQREGHVRAGPGPGRDGSLNPRGRERALAALKRFALLAEGMDMAPLTVVATAAVREAEDGEAFREQVLRETGLKLWVINGAEEARLSAQGVLLGWPDAKGIVSDIGGSSMELAEVGGGKVGARATSPLGPFRLQQVEGGPKARRAHIVRVLGEMKKLFPAKHPRLYLVGGSWRVIARLDMERRAYPLTVLHEYRMMPEQILETLDWIATTTLPCCGCGPAPRRSGWNWCRWPAKCCGA